MRPDPAAITVLVTGVAGCLAAVFCLLALRRARADFDLEVAHVQEEQGRSQAACSARIDELKREFQALCLSMQNTDELMREGRLSRSSRAQAMQLLRSGVSPDTAASTLGIAKREMHLLAKVLASLSIP